MKTDKTEPAQLEVTRSSFLRKLWMGLGIVAFAEFIGVTVAFLLPRKPGAKEGEFGGIVIAGAVDRFETNTVTAFQRGKFYLARLEDGGFLALSRKCTHLGCTVPWVSEKNKFECPCHASAFDIQGNVISAPAPRALDIYPVKIENQIVKVDTGKVIQRKMFEEAQVVKP
jgi:cytochrome b6-f complex iron-sulfur subunit